MNHDIDPLLPRAVANAIHQDRVQKILERTGGEIMNPDHYDFQQELRDAVLKAFDETTEKYGLKSAEDRDLPGLFRCLDPLAETLFRRSKGFQQ